jgi:hypothetical protein
MHKILHMRSYLMAGRCCAARYPCFQLGLSFSDVHLLTNMRPQFCTVSLLATLVYCIELPLTCSCACTHATTGEHYGCARQPLYGYEGERPRCCSTHKSADMVRVGKLSPFLSAETFLHTNALVLCCHASYTCFRAVTVSTG